MDKATYLAAVRRAKRILGYIQIAGTRRQAIHLSKVKAAALVTQVSPSGTINATWADDERAYLLVGGYGA